MIFDLIFVIVIGLAFWWGFQKGVIHTIFAILVYFFGVLGAVRFSYILIKYLKQWTGLSQKPLSVIAFILMFLLIVLMVRIVEWLLESVLQQFSLNGANKIAGGVLHALAGLYFLCVLLWYGKGFNIVPKDQREMSHVYRYIDNIAPSVMTWTGAIVPIVKETYTEMEHLLIDAPKKDAHSSH